MSEAMEDGDRIEIAQPELRRGRRMSPVWIVPIVAILLGAWLFYRHLAEQGPLIQVSFHTAEGIVKGKTEVRCRSVRVGVVESVRLAENLNSVEVSLRLDPEAADLLTEGSRFWVVRPRVSGATITGLGTIISGAYIALEPGVGGAEKKNARFVGLEQPPVTPAGVPGLRLTLLADRGGKAEVGAPMLYLGNEVGRVERSVFDPASGRVALKAFIKEDYAGLVTEHTRFWLDNVVEVEVGADGFKLKMPSLASIVTGGITFGVPAGVDHGMPVDNNISFTLYNDEAAAVESAFESAGEMLLLFDQSIRGLAVGAPVEFRGLPVGRVSGISFQHAPKGSEHLVPVVIQLNKYLLEDQFPKDLRDEGRVGLKRAVQKGLRASLKSGNLLTGQLFVELDYYESSNIADIRMEGDMIVLPTVESGIQLLEGKMVALLNKLENLDVEGVLAKIGEAAEEGRGALQRSEAVLEEARDAVAAIRVVVEDDSFSRLPGDLRETLAELRTTLEGMGPNSRAYGDLRRTMDELRSAARSIERMAATIDDKPNSLIFGKGGRTVVPKAVRVNE